MAAPALAQDTASADPAVTGEHKLQTICAPCHSVSGAEPIANYPILAGQNAAYLRYALKAYRTGERDNAIMAQARDLTDGEIDYLAEHYATQPSPLR